MVPGLAIKSDPLGPEAASSRTTAVHGRLVRHAGDILQTTDQSAIPTLFHSRRQLAAPRYARISSKAAMRSLLVETLASMQKAGREIPPG